MNSSTLLKQHNISFYGIPPSAGPVDGFSYAGLKMVQTLKKMGYEVPWRDEKSPVSISFCQPDWYSHESRQFRIGYTPWESTEIPAWWVKEMNNMDAMWTTSTWCRDVFKKNGVYRDIDIVPHGIDSDEWAISKRNFSGKFTFFHMGEPATRKNGQMAFDAFVKVFGKNPYVNFVMKSNGYAEARNRDPFGPITLHPRARLITEKTPVEYLSGLYNSVHCMIYPSNGEGFGLIPFQAMATGMPTILPSWSGMADFSKYGIELEYKVHPSGHAYHHGDWGFPSFQDLCEKMEYVYENYEKISATAYENGLELRERYSWDAIMKNSLALV